MGTCNKFRNFLSLVVLLTLFLILAGTVTPFAQGTAISIEDISLTPGDSATIYVTLDKAIDGLGRLDATIVNRSPEIVQLSTISPEAVSDEFLQIDSESGEEIKFKLVDLGNNIDPGDQNVQLVSFDLEAVKAGEAEIGLEGIKYTDEDGNVIEPNVTPSTVTVRSSEPEKEEPASSDQDGGAEGESTTGEETKIEKEQQAKEPEQDEEEPTKEPAETEVSYKLQLKEIDLRLGAKRKVTLSISSLPDGFRLAETTIRSEGVKVDDVTGKSPLYYEVVDSSRDSIHFRVGDFDGEVGPDTSELELGELYLEGTSVGWANLQVRVSIRTDDGKEVIRSAELADIKVFQPAILGTDSPPQDPDGDGLYEDVDGDGELTEEDVFALAVNLKNESGAISAPMLDVFDFNQDGVVNFDDPVKLMRMTKERG